MLTQKSSRGQAIVLIVFAIIGLFGITALAVDGGNAFANQRHAQSAADNSALASALQMAGGLPTLTESTIKLAATNIATENGFSGDTVVFVDIGAPFIRCNNSSIDPTDRSAHSTDLPAYYVQVKIKSKVKTYFGQIIGINEVNNCVDAIARGKPYTYDPLFDGNAVVGLDPDIADTCFGTGGTSVWDITGGGIFSNCKSNGDGVTFDEGICVTSVGTATGFNCTPQLGVKVNYPSEVAAIMPPEPPCDGTYEGGQLVYWDKFMDRDFSPPSDIPYAVYCLTGAEGSSKAKIRGTHVVFYVKDPTNSDLANTFEFKFAGGGGSAGWEFTAPEVGPYAHYAFILPIGTESCLSKNGAPTIQLRGLGTVGVKSVVGTIMAPSACIDLGANSYTIIDGQVVGYQVTSGGGGHADINYDSSQNPTKLIPPVLELIK